MLRHSLTWEKQERDLIKQRDYLTFGLVRTGLCVMLQNDNLDYEYIANLPKIWSQPSADTQPTDVQLFGDRLGSRLLAEKAILLESGEKRDFEWASPDGLTFRFIIELVFDRDNGKEIFTTVKDLTTERQRENVLHTLLKEVSHRSKNLLAMVQSVAFQTARNSDDLDRFMERFRGRLQSLSFSQDAITQTDWQGSHVLQLIEKQKKLFSPSVQKLILFEGENVLLSPNSAMHLGLAIHELISNATHFGTFIEKNEEIVISVHTTQDQVGAFDVSFHWHEKLGSNSEVVVSATDNAKKKFGSIILERIVPAALSGSAELLLDRKSTDYILKFPKSA